MCEEINLFQNMCYTNIDTRNFYRVSLSLVDKNLVECQMIQDNQLSTNLTHCCLTMLTGQGVV